jgi:hypothetical protein
MRENSVHSTKGRASLHIAGILLVFYVVDSVAFGYSSQAFVRQNCVNPRLVNMRLSEHGPDKPSSECNNKMTRRYLLTGGVAIGTSVPLSSWASESVAGSPAASTPPKVRQLLAPICIPKHTYFFLMPVTCSACHSWHSPRGLCSFDVITERHFCAACLSDLPWCCSEYLGLCV